MKYLIASDIHGSAYWAERLCTAIESEQPTALCCWATCSTTARVTTCRATTPPNA